MGDDPTAGTILEGLELRAEANGLIEAFEEYAPQGGAADRPFRIVILAVYMLKIDSEQHIKLVVEERDTGARVGRSRDQLAVSGSWQAIAKRGASGGADTQAVTRSLIFRRAVAFEDLRGNAIRAQAVGEAQATSTAPMIMMLRGSLTALASPGCGNLPANASG